MLKMLKRSFLILFGCWSKKCFLCRILVLGAIRMQQRLKMLSWLMCLSDHFGLPTHWKLTRMEYPPKLLCWLVKIMTSCGRETEPAISWLGVAHLLCHLHFLRCVRHRASARNPKWITADLIAWDATHRSRWSVKGTRVLRFALMTAPEYVRTSSIFESTWRKSNIDLDQCGYNNKKNIPQITINRWYKPFPNRWFMALF